MILAILAESALRSLLLGGVVWIGLNLLRARNPQLHMTSWIVVLAASLAMPLLMHWTTVTVTLQALPMPAPETLLPESFRPAATMLLEPLAPSLALDSVAPAALPVMPVASHAPFTWLALASAVYAVVAGMLLLRIAVGVYLTWRLARSATPVDEPWTEGRRVRVSDRIGGPVTFGSTILLPPQFREWDVRKRQAVLAHEGAHVANRDFHVLLLASINRAVFWFSPFAWWQLTRLAELAELISDARAIEVIEDRCSYAEILLDLVQRVRYAPAGLEMARACTVKTRVERILAAAAMPAPLGWRKRAGMAAAILPLAVASAISITYTRPVASTPAVASAPEPAAPRMLERVTFYSLNRASIFAISRNGDEVFGQLSGQRKVRLAAAGDGNWSYPAANGQITFAISDAPKSELTLSQNGKELRVARIADLDRQDMVTASPQPDAYVGAYELNASHMLAVTREGGRLFVEEIGQPKFEVTALGADAFSGEAGRLVVFLRNEHGKVNQMLIQEPAFGARLARWIKPERAKIVQDEFARRVAEVPDRFKDQAPQPGGKEAILRGIADVQRGAPNYERMSMALATKVRRQAAELQAQLNAFGAVESIFFRGVGPGGYDIYGVKFAKGFAEFRSLLGADGKAEDVLFRPDGNEALGGVTSCAGEADLKAREDTVPIQLQIYNGSGGELQLFRLDADGKRQARGTISEQTSSPVVTYVGSPWVIADASGKCLEIVVPGQQTRFHVVENLQPAGQRAARTTPQPGSEAMLRRYIEDTSRGEPDYDHMTAEVAAHTRRQLPFNQAIFARLGALRSVSFRGVSAMGNDVYLGHFANGTAEFRIGLVKDCTTIGRIALGPQS